MKKSNVTKISRALDVVNGFIKSKFPGKDYEGLVVADQLVNKDLPREDDKDNKGK